MIKSMVNKMIKLHNFIIRKTKIFSFMAENKKLFIKVIYFKKHAQLPSEKIKIFGWL